MKEMSEIDEVKVDYDKLKKAEENKNKKTKKNYQGTSFTTVKEMFINSSKEYAIIAEPPRVVYDARRLCCFIPYRLKICQ